MQAKAVLFTGVNHVTLDTVNLPDPGPGEVLVQAAYSCISPGTELRCLAGKQPGLADWPFIPGYAMAGTVLATGSDTTIAPGTPVFCGGTRHADQMIAWGAHISHAIQMESSLIILPPKVDLLEAALARLGAIAYHGLRLSRPQPHEKVVIVGLGPIGQLAARLYTLTGVLVVAADLSPERVALAQQAGVEAFVLEGPLATAFKTVFPEGADIIVDATGAPPVLPQLVDLARDLPWDDTLTPGTRLVVQGSYPAEFAVPYQDAFVKELTILIPRDHQPRDLRTVLDLISRCKLAVRDLITEVRSPEAAPMTYAELREGQLMTAAFRWT